MKHTQSIIKYAFMLGLVLLLMQCKHAATESQPEIPSKDLNGGAVSELYQYYVENPSLQAHKDENLIIDYIVENELIYERLPSGLYYKIVKQGSGDNYKIGDNCVTHYNGYFLDGNSFDSSYKRNEPIRFRVGQMNPSWNEILQIVNPGTQVKIIAPSRLAYGERGFPGYVPPNTVIAFDIETIAG